MGKRRSYPRLPDSVVAQLEEIADKTGRSRNEIMLLCIQYALENLEMQEE